MPVTDNFSLEDKLTYEELAPSLQDMFKLLNIGSIITDVMENGTNGRNVKIDSRNSLLFEDDDFRTAKITDSQIMVSDINMINWDVATKQTESDPSTQVIPNRIFLYDVGTTNLWYYQDWNNKWCIRKDVSVDTTKAKPGDIVKLDENNKLTFDSNFRLKRMVGPSNSELYTEARRNPKACTYTDNDYNIYVPSLDVYYNTNNTSTYPPSNATDQQALNSYYTLSNEKAASKLTSRTWYYNEGQGLLFFYKYKKKLYELNADYRDLFSKYPITIEEVLYKHFTNIEQAVSIKTVNNTLIYPDESYVKAAADTQNGRGFYFYAVKVPYNCRIISYTAGAAQSNYTNFREQARIFVMTENDFTNLSGIDCVIKYDENIYEPNELDPLLAESWSQIIPKDYYICAWNPNIFKQVIIRKVI